MLEKIMEAGTGVYILWGMGMLGLLLKIMVNTYLKGMVRASENMATTRRKSLRIIRQKYENGKSLGKNAGNNEAYVEKNVRKLRFFALPLEFWRRSGQALCCTVFMAMAGSFLYYDVNWRGSPDMVSFLANGFMVCAFLLAIENIFLVNNKVEILKANIRDYLENVAPPRDLSVRAPVRGPKGQGRGVNGEIGKQDMRAVCEDGSAFSAATDMTDVSGASDDAAAVAANSGKNNEEILDCFLKEFFS